MLVTKVERVYYRLASLPVGEGGVGPLLGLRVEMLVTEVDKDTIAWHLLSSRRGD